MQKIYFVDPDPAHQNYSLKILTQPKLELLSQEVECRRNIIQGLRQVCGSGSSFCRNPWDRAARNAFLRLKYCSDEVVKPNKSPKYFQKIRRGRNFEIFRLRPTSHELKIRCQRCEKWLYSTNRKPLVLLKNKKKSSKSILRCCFVNFYPNLLFPCLPNQWQGQNYFFFLAITQQGFELASTEQSFTNQGPFYDAHL